MKIARRPEKILQVKGKILDHALDIIAKSGLDGLTMRRLGASLSMTAPNIYNYFSCKEEIYLSIVIRGFEMLYVDMKTACVHEGGTMARVRAMTDAYMKFGLTHPQYYGIMFTSPTPKYNDYVGTPFEPLSQKELEFSMKIAEMALKTASTVMGIPEGHPAVLRRVIHVWSLIHGMISLQNSHVVDYVIESPETVFNEIVDEVLAYLSNPS
ncbi:MAG: TetR/AcrR family transcriptional regulator [Deltaproteobacteria bacterium]|nr:TetR/AcrR family transcriptional regulator [Deltaproteobacteria bacterium]